MKNGRHWAAAPTLSPRK
jgi:hypothetical protein